MENGNWKSVTMLSGFLYEKALVNRKITMQAVWDRFKDTGRIDAFLCKPLSESKIKPHIYWDSDVAKWMEAAAYLLGGNDCPELREKLEWLIDQIEKNQRDDGYFNTYFMTCEPQNIFSDRDAHELYCAGHLIEAACAYYESCGNTRFLNLMKKYADYIYKVFVTDKTAGFCTPGHEEIELASMRLYRTTGEQKYLELCMYFINTRGMKNEEPNQTKYLPCYNQSHIPVRMQKEAVGHSVRALYLYSAMADAAAETDDPALLNACKSLFCDIISSKIYITGGVGQNHTGESFSVPYDLNNETAYAETCASIAMILFCERMFSATRSSQYTDMIERELYNGMMSGLSINGREFFYTNPLEINLVSHKRMLGNADWLPQTQRSELFDCSCCPPNINRTLASMERFIYSVQDKMLYVNQFVKSEYHNGGIHAIMETDYPESGKISFIVSGTESVLIRIPDWCRKFDISVECEMINGYARISAERFFVNFDMTPQYIMCNENSADNANKIAITRGPVVYCAERIDNDADLHNLYIDTSALPICEKSTYFSLPILLAKGYIRKTGKTLYCPLQEQFQKTVIRLIPYYGFANRGETDMRLWFYYK